LIYYYGFACVLEQLPFSTSRIQILVIIIFTMRVKVTRNYQVTIPAEIRSRLGIREGDYVEVTFDEKNGVI